MITLSFVCNYDIFLPSSVCDGNNPAFCSNDCVYYKFIYLVHGSSFIAWNEWKWYQKTDTDDSMIRWFKETYDLSISHKIYKKTNHINLKSFLAPWGELYIDSEKCCGMKSICLYHDKCEFVYLYVS